LQGVIAAISRGWMKYNSLQLKLERRAVGGFYLLGAYTYSTSTTNGVSGFGGDPGIVYFPVVSDDDLDVASSNTDLRHNFTASVLYNLPGDSLTGVARAILANWSVNTIFVAQTGYPLGMSMSTNQAGTSFGNRPDRVCDGELDDPTVERWFDTSCFVAPAVGVLGNAARTTLFGPGRWNADLALTKRAGPLQFRVEIFNVFNHAQFAVPNTVVGSPTFGRITSTVKSSRQVQLAVKYLF
jgi:hypothetical protein